MTSLRAVRHRPVEPRQAAARRVAGDAGIGDRHIVALGAKRRLQFVGKAFAGPEAKARHQAVAEADDLEGLGARRRNGAANGEEKDEGCGKRVFESHAAGPI